MLLIIQDHTEFRDHQTQSNGYSNIESLNNKKISSCISRHPNLNITADNKAINKTPAL
jgi:hypothetical protein